MKWKNVDIGHTFEDGSEVTQRHQTHMYDCYKLTYEHEGEIKTFIGSKDHLIKVNISKLSKEAQETIKEQCKGKIPVKENLVCEVLGYVTDEQKNLIQNYVEGKIDKSYFKEVEDLSEDSIECYLFTFKDNTYKEVFVKRFTIEEESQKIDDENYWIPLEGINWLVNAYGELEI